MVVSETYPRDLSIRLGAWVWRFRVLLYCHSTGALCRCAKSLGNLVCRFALAGSPPLSLSQNPSSVALEQGFDVVW